MRTGAGTRTGASAGADETEGARGAAALGAVRRLLSLGGVFSGGSGGAPNGHGQHGHGAAAASG